MPGSLAGRRDRVARRSPRFHDLWLVEASGEDRASGQRSRSPEDQQEPHIRPSTATGGQVGARERVEAARCPAEDSASGNPGNGEPVGRRPTRFGGVDVVPLRKCLASAKRSRRAVNWTMRKPLQGKPPGNQIVT